MHPNRRLASALPLTGSRHCVSDMALAVGSWRLWNSLGVGSLSLELVIVFRSHHLCAPNRDKPDGSV